MNDNKQQNQSRFLIAAVLSMIVLFGWSYFFAPKPKPNANANVDANVTANSNTAQTPSTPLAQQTPAAQPIATTPDKTPNKVLTINTPLYKVKLDSKGALATSWILVKNVSTHGEKELWAEGSNKETKIPLELIPQDNPKREFPFRIDTGDANLDSLINEKNYSASGEGEITLNGSESKQIDFTFKEGDVEVSKTFVFRADSYLTDLQIKATRGGQTIPDTKLFIGSAIGDQGIKFHNYYHIESEGVGFVNGTTDRHVASSLVKKDPNNSSQNLEVTKTPVAGDIDWAGVGDTYFGMAAIPAQKTNGLEYQTRFLTVQVEPYYDGIISFITQSKKNTLDRHLVSALVPINADGSTTQIYTGTKDYFTLRDYDAKLTNKNIGDFINYSWYPWLRWIQKPIAQVLLICLTAIYGVIGNFGVAIIIFTFIFYSIFFPLRWYSSKSFKKAQANAPKMKELQEKMKEMQKKGVPLDDPKMRALQMEQLKMTKDAIPIGGCLPLLLQMPLFVAFYTAVTIGLDFRQASFLWFPDLSAADPYHILEFLFAASMAGTMIFTPTTPAVTDEQKMQQKMMTYMMPLMMLWVMWGYPAGMLLYWLFGNIVSFGQQFIINRLNKPAEVPMKTV
jgi:YidC/Oxa1 family membrane protein insertase